MRNKISWFPALSLAVAAMFILLNAQISTVFAQGTAFTYQGRLASGTNAANGVYDFQFQVFDAASGGSSYGVPNPNTVAGVPVTNGMFTATLDFGTGVFTGAARWLQISTRTNGVVSFTLLTPRQPLTPTPYAIMASSANNLLGPLPTFQLSGTVANGQLANNALTVSAGPGLSGGGVVALGGATTLNNAGVLSVTGNADITASPTTGGVVLGSTATDANSASRIVKRDGSGNFSAGTVTLAGNLNLPATTATSGALYAGGNLLLHDYGSGNFFAGLAAGNLTMSGGNNVGIGPNVLDANTSGGLNTALGYNALSANTNGNFNTAEGFYALAYNTSGSDDTAVGSWALQNNTVGGFNTAVGTQANMNNTNGSYNTAVGYSSAYYGSSGYYNVALGYGAGFYPTNGNYNIHIGSYGAAADNYIIRVGMQGYQAHSYIAGIYGNVVSNGIPVYVDSNGQLGSSAGSPVALLGGSQTFTGTTTFNPPSGPPFAVGNSTLVANLNADLLDGMNNTAFWNINGNAGTTGGINFVGTTDNQPIEFRVNNLRALRLDYASGLANLTVNPVNNSVNTYASTIAGGNLNQIQTGAYYSLIGGGYNNQVQTNCYYSVVGGGSGNQIQVSGANSSHYGIIGGGSANVLEAYGYNSVIAGGSGNRVQYDGDDAVIGGGYSNLVGTNADYATIAGGYNNTANGYAATIPGGLNNKANGQYSFAAGQNATANDNHSFVWSDGTAGTNSGPNSFDIFASGGIHVNQSTIYLRSNNDRNHGLTYASTWNGRTIDGPVLYGWSGGALAGCNSAPGDQYTLVWDWGGNVWISNNCSVATLTIRGGSDLAEPFDISGSEVAEGAVVVIDEENPGHLKLSDCAYDTRVAGVVSGAKGINPGIQMYQQGILEGGKNVALTGRVYVQADASNGPIRPGDMLTTSSTPGHAMKVSDHTKAAGAVLGKAMTGLKEGKGMVLVLVTLQ